MKWPCLARAIIWWNYLGTKSLLSRQMVDIHKYVESKDMASQQVGPPDWSWGRDTSNTPMYQFTSCYEIWSESNIAPSVQVRWYSCQLQPKILLFFAATRTDHTWYSSCANYDTISWNYFLIRLNCPLKMYCLPPFETLKRRGTWSLIYTKYSDSVDQYYSRAV